MRKWQVHEVAAMLKKCGTISMNYYENPLLELKDDHTIVTVADKEVEECLSKQFDNPDNNIFMIGEETVATKDEKYISNALKETAWIIDPIDGTAPYANHIPTWGISIGFAQEGKIKEGAIYLPVSGDIFITDGTKVLYGTELFHHKSWDAMDLKELSPVIKKTDETGLITLSQSMTKKGRFNGYNPIHTVCSAVYSLGNMVLGRYLAYIATVKIWDMAAGLAILQKCGFKIRQVSGMEMNEEISEKYYFLNKNDKKRWQVTEHIIFAPTDEAIDFALDKINLPE